MLSHYSVLRRSVLARCAVGRAAGATCLALSLPAAASEPHLALTIDLRSFTFPRHAGSFDGNVETSPIAYSFPRDALADDPLRTYGFALGGQYYPLPFLYLGADFGAGVGAYNGPSFSTDNLTIDPRGSVNVSMTSIAGIGGLRLPLGEIALRADARFGVAWISIEQYATNSTNHLTATATSSALFVEPRVILDARVSPLVTVGVFASAPGLDWSAPNVGLTIGVHARSPDKDDSVF